MIEFLERRRSVSALQLIEPGPDDATLLRLMAVAARVPDHGKFAPWRFLIIDGKAKAALETKFAAIAERRPDSNRCIAGLKKARAPAGLRCCYFGCEGCPIPEWE